MTTQFKRVVRVIVGPPGQEGRVIEGLRISFEVIKADGFAINSAKVKIYNASDDTIAVMSTRDASIQVFAGYREQVGLIFLGTVTRVTASRQGADRVIEVESADGFANIGKPAALTIKGGASLKDAFGPLAGIAGQALDFAGVNPDEAIPAPRGVTLSGPVYGQINRIARLNRLDWTVEDDRIVIVRRGESTQLPALVITPDTGLIGSPKPGEARRVEVKMLLNPGARLRRIIQLESRDISGWFLIRRIKHVGDSGFASDFYTELEASIIRRRSA